MKITTKVQYDIDLELTQEQLEAFDAVSDIICLIYEEMRDKRPYYLVNNDSGECLSERDMDTALNVLGSLAGASGFHLYNDED